MRRVLVLLVPLLPVSVSFTGLCRSVTRVGTLEAKPKGFNQAPKGFGKAPKRGKGSSGGADGSGGSRRPPPLEQSCACGSGEVYGSCCQPLHMGGPAKTPEQLLRARFTAYTYRLPDFLGRTLLAKAQQLAEESDIEAFDKGVRNKRNAADAEEREEILRYIDSYDFSNLVVRNQEPINDMMHKISFGCTIRSRGLRVDGRPIESEILDEQTLHFREVSTFRRLQPDGPWFYDVGEVSYAGKTMEENIQEKRAEREQQEQVEAS